MHQSIIDIKRANLPEHRHHLIAASDLNLALLMSFSDLQIHQENIIVLQGRRFGRINLQVVGSKAVTYFHLSDKCADERQKLKD